MEGNLSLEQFCGPIFILLGRRQHIKQAIQERITSVREIFVNFILNILFFPLETFGVCSCAVTQN